MVPKMSLQEAKERALELLRRGYRCGPTVLQVMWEAYELGSEDLLWSCIAFNGGISGLQQAPCGAISAAAVCSGLKRRCSLSEKQKAKQARLEANRDANELVSSFINKFGALTCLDLTGVDFSKPGAEQQFMESGMWQEKCENYVQFVIEKLYEKA